MTPVCESVPETTSGFQPGWISTRAQIALATCACAGATAFLYAVDPNRHAVYPQCLLFRTTGIYCAGCGATRAIHALLHGRIIEALHDNALLVATLPLFLFLAGSHLMTGWRANAWPKVIIQERNLIQGGIIIFILMLSFMALRNLPGWPFDYFKPIAD